MLLKPESWKAMKLLPNEATTKSTGWNDGRISIFEQGLYNPYFPNKLHKQELVAYNKAA
jgi:hypothetical protein